MGRQYRDAARKAAGFAVGECRALQERNASRCAGADEECEGGDEAAAEAVAGFPRIVTGIAYPNMNRTSALTTLPLFPSLDTARPRPHRVAHMDVVPDRSGSGNFHAGEESEERCGMCPILFVWLREGGDELVSQHAAMEAYVSVQVRA
jgi:hypothetical protein